MCVLSTFKTFSDFHLTLPRHRCRLRHRCRCRRHHCNRARSLSQLRTVELFTPFNSTDRTRTLTLSHNSRTVFWLVTIFSLSLFFFFSRVLLLLLFFFSHLVKIGARARTRVFILHLFWPLFNLRDFIYWLNHSRISNNNKKKKPLRICY